MIGRRISISERLRGPISTCTKGVGATLRVTHEQFGVQAASLLKGHLSEPTLASQQRHSTLPDGAGTGQSHHRNAGSTSRAFSSADHDSQVSASRPHTRQNSSFPCSSFDQCGWAHVRFLARSSLPSVSGCAAAFAAHALTCALQWPFHVPAPFPPFFPIRQYSHVLSFPSCTRFGVGKLSATSRIAWHSLQVCNIRPR
jgi:hypothetical protein